MPPRWKASSDVAASVPGRSNVRMLRGEVPRLFPAAEPLRLDSPVCFRAAVT